MNTVAILAATAALNWTMPDGKVVSETQELVPFDFNGSTVAAENWRLVGGATAH